MAYKRLIYAPLLIAAGALIFSGGKSSALDFSNPKIPVEQILSGGPPKDGIPAILEPKFVSAKEADNFLNEKDIILGMSLEGIARAYPIKILNWHEIVNDKFKGRHVFVTYCPLCGTGMAFDSMVDGKRYSFGVSGLLFNSDVLFYDHQTESLWSQIIMGAVTGKMSGKGLTPLPVLHTTWKNWKKKHPDTVALSLDTGYRRDYANNPYGRYDKQDFIMFPVSVRDKRYHSKERVIGIKINGKAKVYPYSELQKSKAPFPDSIGGKKVNVHFEADSSTAYITDENGELLSSIAGFWFAWYAFNPNAEVYTAK